MALRVFQSQPDFLRTNLLPVRLMRIGTAPQNLAFVTKPQRSPVRYSRTNGQQLPFLRRIEIHLRKNFRPRSDNAHFALQHIYELGQFIEFIFSEKRSEE